MGINCFPASGRGLGSRTLRGSSRMTIKYISVRRLYRGKSVPAGRSGEPNDEAVGANSVERRHSPCTDFSDRALSGQSWVAASVTTENHASGQHREHRCKPPDSSSSNFSKCPDKLKPEPQNAMAEFSVMRDSIRIKTVPASGTANDRCQQVQRAQIPRKLSGAATQPARAWNTGDYPGARRTVRKMGEQGLADGAGQLSRISARTSSSGFTTKPDRKRWLTVYRWVSEFQSLSDLDANAR